jgi:hypothetical protein
MMLISVHVVGIGLLVLVVGSLAYRMGYDKAERRYRRAIQRMEVESPRASGADSA